MTLVKDLNLFHEGQQVDIDGLPQMIGLKIERISDSGVTVSGSSFGAHIVLSGRSPAHIHVPTNKPIIKLVKTKSVNTEQNNMSNPDTNTALSKKARKSHGDKMSSLQMPPAPFTIRQLAEANDIPLVYAHSWVKTNCIEAGLVPRKEGQRGKCSALFNVK
jgi:hypothetical protein